MLNHINHDAAHYMIQALSMTEAGSDLVKGLEEIRYYHRHAEVYDLGYNGILVEAFDEDTDGDRYWEGSVLIPSKRDRPHPRRNRASIDAPNPKLTELSVSHLSRSTKEPNHAEDQARQPP